MNLDVTIMVWGMIKLCASAEEAEALAFLEAVRKAVKYNPPAVLESDCSLVVEALKCQARDLSATGTIT